MKRLSTVALLAALAVAYSIPAFAQFSTAPHDPGCTSNCVPGNPGDPGDADDPGDPAEPGEPFVPGDPEDPEDPGDKGDSGDSGDGDKPGDPGNPGDPGGPGDPGDPGLTPDDQAQLRACEHRLSSLGRVSADQIASLSSPNEVSLFPICEAKSLAEAKPMLIDKGNAEGLEGVIRSNELLLGKLKSTSYKPHDVVGIEFDADGNATLYVHKRG